MVRSKSMLNSAHLPFRVNSVFTRNNCIQRTIPDQKKTQLINSQKNHSFVDIVSQYVSYRCITHVLQTGVKMCLRNFFIISGYQIIIVQ